MTRRVLILKFKLFVDNVHCKHVILCASSDKSYTGFLRQYVDHDRKHITLVESIPFPHALAEVARQFPQIKFDSVFRHTKLLSKDSDFAAQKGQEALASRPSYATTLSQSQNGITEQPSERMQPILLNNGTAPDHNTLHNDRRPSQSTKTITELIRNYHITTETLWKA
ncbi:hypothetical protein LTS15_000010 [Exophiala xenobiotica]|nr:hypothetical protein LTS15_000010 [Exophiala xenobiotica]